MYVKDQHQQSQHPVISIFFKIVRWLRNYFTLVGALVSFSLFFAIMFSKKQAPATLAKDAEVYLNLKLEGSIQESTFQESYFDEIFKLLTDEPRSLHLLEIRQKLESAANDPRVKALFLELHHVDGSFAAFTELRTYLETFKKSEKPIFAWFAHGSNKTYYLSSVANKIYMAPVGDLVFPGPSFELMYFGNALKKIGIDIEVVKAGKYKSAFEPFIMNEPSLASREMYNSMRESLQNHMDKSIRGNRKIPSGQSVTKWVRQTIFTPSLAKRRGLVDEIASLKNATKLAFESPTLKKHDFLEYNNSEAQLNLERSEDGIALIDAVGEIHLTQQSGDSAITPKQLGEKLRWAAEDEQVKAVVLRISSPGGSATASDMIWSDVKALADKKPVVVSMAGVAASGGYYIAAPAQKIFADETTVTGSIGVIGMIPKFRQFNQKYGISFHMISESDRKQLLNLGGTSTKQDKLIMSESIDIVYQMFLKRVAEGRKMSKKSVHEIAQGRVWTGMQAKEIGLVDEIGGLWEAIQEAKKLANMDTNRKYPLLRWKRKFSSLSHCLMDYKKCIPSSNTHKEHLSILNPWDSIEKISRFNNYLTREPIQAVWMGGTLN